MNLFIDTNILLSFYHYKSDDLGELKKLIAAIEAKRITLFVPQQVKDEFYRNREAKLSDALQIFEKEKLNESFPQICKNYPEYAVLRQSIESYQREKSQLIAKLTTDIMSESLQADEVVKQLFSKTEIIGLSAGIWKKAKQRHELRNPPGKKDSYGDAVNWETLLESVPDGEDLYFITEDSDYFSEIDKEQFCPFLIAEWKTRKASNILFFRRLSFFFKDKFPKITLASEFERDLLVQSLAASSNFSTTHSTIAKLSQYDDFTKAQVDDLLTAFFSNSQVNWIKDDRDVHNFFEKLRNDHGAKATPEVMAQFMNLWNPPPLELPPLPNSFA